MTLLGLVLLGHSHSTWGVDAQVQISADEKQTHWVGEQLVLHVDLLSDGLSFENQRFVIPAIEGAILLQDAATTVKLNRQVNGESWQVLRYDFPLFPQRSGVLSIPPIGVSFAVTQGYGTTPSPFSLETDALDLQVDLPPGAVPGQPLISTSDFSLEVTQSPQPSTQANQFVVGDALSRTVQRQANDLSAMFFAPLSMAAPEGVTSYPSNPEVRDQSQRGQLVGKRTDRITYVFERPGTFTLEGTSIWWWNPARENLSQVEIPAIEVTVVANDASSSASQLVDHEQLVQAPLKRTAWVALGSIIALGILILALLTIYKKRVVHPESAQFSLLQRACRHNDARGAFNAWNRWCSLLARPVSESTHAKAAQDILRETQEAIVDPKRDWRGRALGRTARTIRQEIGRDTGRGIAHDTQHQSSNRVTLPPLNPIAPSNGIRQSDPR